LIVVKARRLGAYPTEENLKGTSLKQAARFQDNGRLRIPVCLPPCLIQRMEKYRYFSNFYFGLFLISILDIP
jgi:hypothetical protein